MPFYECTRAADEVQYVPAYVRGLEFALRRLVDECDAILDTLACLPEDTLPAWAHNLWYDALVESRHALDPAQIDDGDAGG